MANKNFARIFVSVWGKCEENYLNKMFKMRRMAVFCSSGVMDCLSENKESFHSLGFVVMRQYFECKYIKTAGIV